MHHASYRYRRATPLERLNMNMRYWFRTHIRDILGFILEMVTGFAWIFSMFFIIIVFAIFAP